MLSIYLFILDSMEVKTHITRKLRRRPNDPVPIPDKRRKPAPDILHIAVETEHMHWKHSRPPTHQLNRPSSVQL